jgi:hypothetical protein
MKEPEIVAITVHEDGTFELSVQGVKGPACEQLTADVEKLLGGEVLSRTHTAEYKEKAVAASQHLRHGLR